MRAIQVTRFGGPDELTVTDIPDPVPEPGELLVEVSAAGVNYADLSRIAGTYSGGVELPFIPGTEIIGRTGDGRRVMALTFGGGGFAESVAIPAADAVEVPADVSDGAALALLVQGLTAWHLLHSSARLRAGESIVVNAAAGGVGTLAVQLAREIGAGRVIAAASTADKRALAIELGADAAIDSSPGGYADRVRAANDGGGVDVVLDAGGGAALTAGLDALGQFGRLVSYGNASRQGRMLIDPDLLSDRNLSVCGFWLRPALSLDNGFRQPLAELLALVTAGRLRPVTGVDYPLDQAREAFTGLAARRTTGKIILRPR